MQEPTPNLGIHSFLQHMTCHHGTETMGLGVEAGVAQGSGLHAGVVMGGLPLQHTVTAGLNFASGGDSNRDSSTFRL